MVIAGAGAIDHAELTQVVGGVFGERVNDKKSSTVMEPALLTGSDKIVRFDKGTLVHVAFSFEGASWTSEYAVPLMVMQTILGSYDRTYGAWANHASKFAQEVAQHNLAHSYTTFNTSYKDTGLFGIYATAPDNKLEDLM